MSNGDARDGRFLEAGRSEGDPIRPDAGYVEMNGSTPKPKFNYDNFWVPGAVVLGVIVGVITDLSGKSDKKPEQHVSAILGWTYFFAWSISFYPQVFINLT